MSKTSKNNVCFCIPGVDSPLAISRYSWAIRFAGLFDYFFFQSLNGKANSILAAADESAIAMLKHRAGKQLGGKDIVSFPTRIDTNVFHPADRSVIRKKLGLPFDAVIAVTTSRIHWAKGWVFLLEAFRIFHIRYPRSLLIFLGDGAERDALKQKARALSLHESVIVTGYLQPTAVAAHLQASNLFVMGSLKEGWSTVLLEALACHVPIVTTRFSSADTIVRNGVNGFSVDRNPLEFAEAMEKALYLREMGMYANSVIDRYALNNLARDLFRVWPLI
jgi:glycosyltransferase involved in cell wall biosynthesis